MVRKMTARLALPDDAPYLKEKLPNWGDEAIAEMIGGKRYMTVVDPPGGLIWVTYDEADPTLIHAGLTFCSSDAQAAAMYKLLIATNPWPKWTRVRVGYDSAPGACDARAVQAATTVAKMPVVATTGTRKTLEITKAALLAALGVKVK